jgi:hypothetical protein
MSTRMMDYADVRATAREALAELQKECDHTGQRPLPMHLVRVETLLLRIIGSTPIEASR